MAAEKILTIYKLADPDNPDQAYLLACLFALNNEKTEAITALKEAMRLGYNDMNKLLQEEAFASLRNTPEFNELINQRQTSNPQPQVN